jgi:hypothetical protein
LWVGRAVLCARAEGGGGGQATAARRELGRTDVQ